MLGEKCNDVLSILKDLIDICDLLLSRILQSLVYKNLQICLTLFLLACQYGIV